MQSLPRQIQITDIGPIKSLLIPIPEDGGVVVLRGRNGSGKSTALSAVSSLTSGKRDRITANRSTGKGAVSGLGASLTVGRRVNATGSFGAVALTGADPSAFVDPGIKDPEAADRARLEALCRIAGIDFDPAELAAVLPNCGEIAREISSMTLAEGGRRVRREVKRFAREALALETEWKANLVAAESAYAGLPDGLILSDHEAHQVKAAEMVDAKRLEVVRVAEQLRLAHDGAADAQAAREELAKVDTSSEDHQSKADELERLRHTRSGMEDERKQLAELLRSKEAELSLVEARGKTLVHEIMTLEQSARHADTLRGIIERGGNDKISSLASSLCEVRQSLADAEALVVSLDDAKAKCEAGDAVKELRVQVEQQAEYAGAWGPAMAHVDDLILRLIRERMPTDRLALEGGRLRARDQSGAVVDLADLSAGERWRIAIDLCVSCLERGAVVVIEQEAWEGLDPGNRQEIAAYARGAGVTVVTAECSDATTIEPLVLGGAS